MAGRWGTLPSATSLGLSSTEPRIPAVGGALGRHPARITGREVEGRRSADDHLAADGHFVDRDARRVGGATTKRWARGSVARYDARRRADAAQQREQRLPTRCMRRSPTSFRAIARGWTKRCAGWATTRICAAPIPSPAAIGVRAATAVLDYRRRDGANQRAMNHALQRRGYSDYTGYAPQNTVDRLTNPDRWQPMRFSDGKGGSVVPGFLRRTGTGHTVRDRLQPAIPSPPVHWSDRRSWRPTSTNRYG